MFSVQTKVYFIDTSHLFFSNKEKLKEILNLHFVRERWNTERIRQSVQVNKFQTNPDKKLIYFSVNTNEDNNLTFTVECGGVNATIIQNDIAATNGYIHIIDRVLGIPTG